MSRAQEEVGSGRLILGGSQRVSGDSATSLSHLKHLQIRYKGWERRGWRERLGFKGGLTGGGRRRKQATAGRALRGRLGRAGFPQGHRLTPCGGAHAGAASGGAAHACGDPRGGGAAGSMQRRRQPRLAAVCGLRLSPQEPVWPQRKTPPPPKKPLFSPLRSVPADLPVAPLLLWHQGLHGSTFGIPVAPTDDRISLDVFPLSEADLTPPARCCPERYYPGREYRIRIYCPSSCAVLLSTEYGDADIGPASAANQVALPAGLPMQAHSHGPWALPACAQTSQGGASLLLGGSAVHLN